jgi:hypothetical protein
VKTELEIAAVLHRDVPTPSENEVVDEFDIEELRGACEPTCVRHIFVRWLRVTGGMIVINDDTPRVVAQRKPEHVARAAERRVERPYKHLALGDDAATRVEEQGAETFLYPVRVLRRQASSDAVEVVESALRRRSESATAELHRHTKAHCIIAGDIRRTGFDAVQERRETVAEQGTCRVEVVFGRHTLACQERDELRVAKRMRAVPKEAYGGLFVVREAALRGRRTG